MISGETIIILLETTHQKRLGKCNWLLITYGVATDENGLRKPVNKNGKKKLSKISHQAYQWYKTVLKIIKNSRNGKNKEDNKEYVIQFKRSEIFLLIKLNDKSQIKEFLLKICFGFHRVVCCEGSNRLWMDTVLYPFIAFFYHSAVT